MARSVGVAAAARARWAAAQGFELGLLLGQRAWSTSQSDVVLASAPVPPESEGGGARGFADVSTEWVADCTQQVERMLPGGVAVLGLYAVTPAAVSTADAFGKALFYLREMDAGDEPLYFVHVAGGAVVAAKSYENVGNAAKTSSAAVDIVELPANLTLKKYHTLIGISESLLFSRVGAPEDIAESRASELKKQLEPLVNRLRSAVCVVEGTEAEGSQAMKVLAPAAAKLEEDDTNCLVGRVRGAIRGVAYVCSTEPEPAKAAAEFLKKDLIKTLLLRVDLAREKWVDHEDDASQDNFELVGRVCLPKRNAIAWKYADGLSRGPFDLSIYTFPEDDISQAAEDAFEVLGGMAALAEDAGVSSLEGLWTTVEQDARTRDEKIAAARKNDPDFAPMPYHYVAMLIPVAIALAFLLMQQARAVHRTLNGDENE